MIREQDIKPIPKYIEKLIKSKYKKDCKNNHSKTCFFAYLTKQNKDLVKITVACKSRGKKFAMKQVAVHGLHSDICLVKDMEFFSMCGYMVGWYNEGLSYTKKDYEDGKWYEANHKYFSPYAPIVNIEFIYKFDEYKYTAVEKYTSDNLFKYLRLYEKYPIAEMLVKLDLSNLSTSITILKEASKNKSFRKWLFNNKLTLKHGWFDISAIIKSFKENITLQNAQQKENARKDFIRSDVYRELKGIIKINEVDKFMHYLKTQNTGLFSYRDYINACRYLNIDLTQDKNKYPHNFKRWHDIRIDEYRTAQIEADKKAKREFANKFKKVANKYISLERNLIKDDYVCILALFPQQLVYEGEKLHHCVGRMNYDQKFAREESLIFFVRNKLAPNTPFVTLEYSIEKKKVLQCYGEHDTKPPEEVLSFVNKIWLPYANRKLRKIA